MVDAISESLDMRARDLMQKLELENDPEDC